jgi:hypothetical protein
MELMASIFSTYEKFKKKTKRERFLAELERTFETNNYSKRE